MTIRSSISPAVHRSPLALTHLSSIRIPTEEIPEEYEIQDPPFPDYPPPQISTDYAKTWGPQHQGGSKRPALRHHVSLGRISRYAKAGLSYPDCDCPGIGVCELDEDDVHYIDLEIFTKQPRSQRMGPNKTSVPWKMSSVVKLGQISHEQMPGPASESESCCCIPTQTVTAAHVANRSTNGKFAIFRYKKGQWPPQPRPPTNDEHIDPPQHGLINPGPSDPTQAPNGLLNPSAQPHIWEYISGHGFAITRQGTVLYCNRSHTLERPFNIRWKADRGTFEKAVCPKDSAKKYRFALFGPGNHTATQMRFNRHNGRGSWRKLLGERSDPDKKDEKPTHIVYMQVPELVTHMIALGVSPQGVVKCLKQGEYGTVTLDFEPGDKWESPEERMTPRELLSHVDKRKHGWYYTERPGMGVWIS
jgi:hypothetical protein